MKLLILSPLPPPPGGIASWSINLIEYSSFFSDCYEIVHQNTALKYQKKLQSNLLNRIYFGILESIRIIYELKTNIKKYSPDIIHLTSSAALALIKDFFIIRIALKKNIPVIVHWHFGRIPTVSVQKNWEWKLLIYIIRKSHTTVVIDSKSYNALIKAGFTNIVNIPNPIGIQLEQNINTFFSSINQRRQNRLIFVGNIIKNKGVFELIEACTRIPLVNELLLIGPYGSLLKQELINIAKKRENGEWLNFYGILENDLVLEQMRITPILVLPSYTEGFPNVVIEGMAMGCAIIASDVGAIPEILDIVSEKPCGICVPAHNVEKLAEAITLLVTNHLKAEILGKNGREKVLKNYTLNKIVEKYKSVWGLAANDLNIKE